MPKERERKFLVRGDGWRGQAAKAARIRQFYLMAGSDRSMRVRLKGGNATLTLKLGAAARERDEYEFPLPLEEVSVLERFVVGSVIEKTRHFVPHGGFSYEVDEYAGPLAGLVIAELETDEIVAATELPSWLGREVTGERAYYNASLALNGLPEMAG